VFLASFDGVAPSTMKKYRRIVRVLGEYAATVEVNWVDEFTLEKLEGMRQTRQILPKKPTGYLPPAINSAARSTNGCERGR
jgi:hypothetical protein